MIRFTRMAFGFSALALTAFMMTAWLSIALCTSLLGKTAIKIAASWHTVEIAHSVLNGFHIASPYDTYL